MVQLGIDIELAIMIESQLLSIMHMVEGKIEASAVSTFRGVLEPQV